MATGHLNGVISHLRRAMLLRDGAGVTDGQLLEDYISRRDEAALEALVQRHGPMVWGVCRRVLSSYHDAEDAFQATFLVLVRRASSLASPELLANWLYGVAHQTAIKARATVAKRKMRERQVTEMPEPAVVEQDLWNDLQPLLDQELSRLPDKYRGVIVLCDLEGKTRKEVAGQLGCAEGTVASRLARARIMLAKRLTQRGVALSGGALAAALAQQAASAGVPSSVVSKTIGAASSFVAGQAAAGPVSVKVATLTEGVLKAMFMSKLKAVSLLLLVMMSCVTVGGFLHQTQAADPTSGTKSQADVPLATQYADPKSGSKSKESDSAKVMTAGEVLSVFDKNEAAGEDRFLGKKVRVNGKVKKVERVSWSDMAPPPIAESNENYYLLTVFADRADVVDKKKDHGNRNGKSLPTVFMFPVSSRKELGGLEEGQQVTIEGVCQGRNEGTIVFTGCQIVKSK